MTTPVRIATAVTALVRGLPGVQTVYPAVPLIGSLPIGPTRDPIVVSEQAGAFTVTTVIGVDHEDAAPEVCRLVNDAIHAFLRASGHEVALVDVKIGSVG